MQLIEQDFISRSRDESTDSFNQHFPYTSLRWYRLSYVCAFLDATDLTQRTGKGLTWATEWACQILVHLSIPPSSSEEDHAKIPVNLEPDPGAIKIMSYAIDHYYVVVAYAAFFLVNSWLNNFIDRECV